MSVPQDCISWQHEVLHCTDKQEWILERERREGVGLGFELGKTREEGKRARDRDRVKLAVGV